MTHHLILLQEYMATIQVIDGIIEKMVAVRGPSDLVCR